MKNVNTKWNFLNFGLVVILALILNTTTGCFGSNAPQRVYFSLDYPLESEPRNETPKYNLSVIVQPFRTNIAYDRQEIVYRANPYEFQYYWYKLWASRPRKILQESLIRHLRHTNLFTNITTAIEDKQPDYIIEADIQAIEELDATATEWYGHLAMRITMTDFKERKVIWTYEFDTKKAVAANEPIYIVKAISEILQSQLTGAFKELDKTLETQSQSLTSQPENVTKHPDTDENNTQHQIPDQNNHPEQKHDETHNNHDKRSTPTATLRK